jgi:hypothetical protein
MANEKISDHPAAGAIIGAELLPVVQSGVNKRSTPDAIKTYFQTAFATVFAQLAGQTSQAFACSNLAFPATQVPSADPNTLDDYEKGTWTPIIGGTGGQSGQSYSTQEGNYVKVGVLASYNFNVQLTAKGTITTQAMIGGFPFSSGSVHGGGSIGLSSGLATAVVSLELLVQAGLTYGPIYKRTGAQVSDALLIGADIANDTQFAGTITCYAA